MLISNKITLFTSIILILIFSNCSFNSSGLNSTNIHVCGNGIIEQGEDCEQDKPLTSTCSEQGFNGGILKCSDSCSFDTSGCTTVICGECVIGTKKCAGMVVMECTSDNNNCGKWVSLINCSESNSVCVESNQSASCQSNCQSNCTSEGNMRCTEDKTSVERCNTITVNTKTCYVWQKLEDCTTGTSCQFIDSFQIAQCSDNCIINEKKCNDDYTLSVCTQDASGFTNWISSQCPVGTKCNNSTTPPECDNCINCTKNDMQCSSDNNHDFNLCMETNNGCTEYQADTCLNDYICLEDVNACILCQECNIGEQQCSSDLTKIQNCGIVNDQCNWINGTLCSIANAHLQQCSNLSGTICEEKSLECSKPFIITSLPFEYQSDNFNRFNDVTFFDNSCHFNTESYHGGKDLFFSLYMTAGQSVTFTEDGGMDSILRILYESDFCSSNSCIADKDSTNSETMTFTAPQNNTYIFVVEAFIAGNINPKAVHVHIY